MYNRQTCFGYVMAISVGGCCLIFSYQTKADTEIELKTAKVVSEEDKAISAKRKSLLNMLNFFDKLVYESPHIKIIKESDNEIAKSLLEKIRGDYVKAREKFDQGNFDEAKKLVRHGFASIPKIFHMVKDKKKARLEIQHRYQDISKRVDSFCLAFADVVSEKGIAVEKLLDLTEIDVLVNKAKTYATENHYNDAYNLMKTVSNRLEVALIKAHHKETLVYKLEFATPEDEYVYELKRNKSYLQVANNLIEHYPPERARRLPLVRRLFKKNDESIAQANKLFASGETRQAISMLEQGTKYLMQALRISGLAL